jgi:hypothetical protein
MSTNTKNTIWLSEDLVNHDLREKFLSAASPYVSDYHVTFSGGYIFLDLSLNIKTIGQLSAKYRLKVMDLTFHQKSHTLYVDYDEDVRPAGGAMQSMLLKAAGLGSGTYLQKALSMVKVSGIRADAKSCSVDLEQLIDLSKGFFPNIELQYADCRDGALCLNYGIRL